jgi:hypothetical protein
MQPLSASARASIPANWKKMLRFISILVIASASWRVIVPPRAVRWRFMYVTQRMLDEDFSA